MKKRLSKALGLLLVLGFCGRMMCAPTVWAAEAGTGDYLQVTGYDPAVDYMARMKACAAEGSENSLLAGWVYEQQRNLKIADLALDYQPTTWFTDYASGAEILDAMDRAARWYTEEDYDLLCRLVMAEMGCDWMPDWVQQLTASVAVNRWKSPSYPDTLTGVVYQPGQYGPASSGAIHNVPSEKVKANCRAALDRWPLYPERIFGQAGHISGAVYTSYTDPVLGTTTWFCYG